MPVFTRVSAACLRSAWRAAASSGVLPLFASNSSKAFETRATSSGLAAFDPMAEGAVDTIAKHYCTDEPFPAGLVVRDPQVIALAVRLAPRGDFF